MSAIQEGSIRFAAFGEGRFEFMNPRDNPDSGAYYQCRKCKRHFGLSIRFRFKTSLSKPIPVCEACGYAK